MRVHLSIYIFTPGIHYFLQVAELHGALTQPQRLDSLRRFKDSQASVLVATDVAARGLDIPGVSTVLNFTLPATLEHYIHRVRLVFH